MENNWAGSIMSILDKIVKLVLLNFYWVLFMLLGLGILGIMPATAAVFLIVRRWMNGEQFTNIFKQFWFIYRSSFTSSNLVGLVFIIFGLFLFADINILMGNQSLIAKVVLAIIFMLCFIYIAMVLNFFPLYARYKMSTFNYIKLSLAIGLSKPIVTLAMMLWVIVVCIVSTYYTVVIPLLFMSLICVGINWLSIKTIEKKLFKNIKKVHVNR